MDRTFLQWPFFEEQHRSVAEHVEQVARDLNVDHSDVDASCPIAGSKPWCRKSSRNDRQRAR